VAIPETGLPQVLVAPLADGCILGILNWNDSESDIEVNLADIGLSAYKRCRIVDVWTGQTVLLGDVLLTSRKQPLHSARLYRVIWLADAWQGSTSIPQEG
jgi:hypothetical protein